MFDLDKFVNDHRKLYELQDRLSRHGYDGTAYDIAKADSKEELKALVKKGLRQVWEAEDDY